MPGKKNTNRPALVLVDLINHFDFPGGKSLGQHAVAMVDNILALRGRFDRLDAPVIYVNDNWTHWRGDLDDLVATCLAAGKASAHLADRLAPERAHYHLLKPKQSAFMASALDVLLQQLEVDALVLAGVATDACVLATGLDAHMRGYRLWVPSDCSAAPTQERHEAALRILATNCNASIRHARGTRQLFPTAGRSVRRVLKA